METVGASLSMVYFSVFTASSFPALSLAKNFSVVVEVMSIGAVYLVELMVGVEPSVV